MKMFANHPFGASFGLNMVFPHRISWVLSVHSSFISEQNTFGKKSTKSDTNSEKNSIKQQM